MTVIDAGLSYHMFENSTEPNEALRNILALREGLLMEFITVDFDKLIDRSASCLEYPLQRSLEDLADEEPFNGSQMASR
ncbi:hypothetical protein SAMN05216597_4064 [Pseudomonas cannabina]|nr:hypothetical protein SAMN05216597_4064 [Pseudomonas cannabina]